MSSRVCCDASRLFISVISHGRRALLPWPLQPQCRGLARVAPTLMRRTIAAAWAAAVGRASARPMTTRTLASSPAPNISPPPRSWRGEGGPREGRRAGTARYLLFLPPTIAAYLCHWQVDRKAWKEGQLERWEAALKVLHRERGFFSLFALSLSPRQRPPSRVRVLRGGGEEHYTHPNSLLTRARVCATAQSTLAYTQTSTSFFSSSSGRPPPPRRPPALPTRAHPRHRGRHARP